MSVQKFTQKISEAIQALNGIDEKKKLLALHLVQFLTPFNQKTIKFSVEDIVDFTSLDESFINQLHDTFENPKESEQIIALLTGLNSDNIIDGNQYLSLLESTLTILMARKLIWSSSKDNDQGSVLHLDGYSVLSSMGKRVKNEDFFPSNFTVTFSDDFWVDLQSHKDQ